MSSATPTNMLITSLLGLSLPTFTIYHSLVFDGGRCLLPSRKNKVRTGMLWILIATMACFNVWSIMWTKLKYELGWIHLPEPYGYIPVPAQLGGVADSRLIAIDVAIIMAFILYDTINLEEAIGWIFLLRSTRQKPERHMPRLSRWINSNVFWIWLSLSSIVGVLHFLIPFWHNSDDQERVLRIFIFEGVSGLVNVALSLVLSTSLPSFIAEVRLQGASDAVLSKLSFFHEMNKIRIALRLIFSAGCLMLGIDAKTDKKTLNLNRFSNDLIFMTLVLAFWTSMIISIMVYLPVSYHKLGHEGSQLTRRRATGMHFGRGADPMTGPRRHSYRSDRPSFKQDRTPSALMSRHSFEHRTLVNLLRERGTIKDGETVPEDALFGLRGEEEEQEDHFVSHHGGRATTVLSDDTYRGGRESDAIEDMLSLSLSPRDSNQAGLERFPSQNSEGLLGTSMPDSIANYSDPFGGVPTTEPRLQEPVVISISQEVVVVAEAGDDPLHSYLFDEPHPQATRRPYPAAYRF